MSHREMLSKTMQFKAILVRRARGEQATEEEYCTAREELINVKAIKDRLPTFAISCRTLQDYWNFIQPKFPSYKERTDYLKQQFDELLSYLEGMSETENYVGDKFQLQFPAGLPFGLTKPNLSLRPQGGTQLMSFEDSADIGVIRHGVYPSLTFARLEEAVNGTPIARNDLKIKFHQMIQTASEKKFFSDYADSFKMFSAEVPVLVPQAWIQWHSLKKDDLRAAGASYANDLYRVDFVFFWKNKRYAILIDDISHYAVKVGERWDASESQYSNRLKEDRKLRKEGWEVFRLSNWEIRNSGLPEILTDIGSIIV